MQKKTLQNSIKIFILFVGLLLFRLIPLRAPNIEPLLATAMPVSKRIGGFVFSFAFPLLSIVAYDLLTSGFGIWTIVTGLAYGGIGVCSQMFFKKRKATAKNFAVFAVIGTIVYDAMTGLTIGPLFFNQAFIDAVLGQVSFTILHLVGNVAFALTISPLVVHFLEKDYSYIRARQSSFQVLQ